MLAVRASVLVEVLRRISQDLLAHVTRSLASVNAGIARTPDPSFKTFGFTMPLGERALP